MVCTEDCISILYQLPQYILITAAEILVSITLLSLAYDEAPVSMKSTVSALNLLTVAFGNLFTMTVTAISPFNGVTGYWAAILDDAFYAGVCAAATLVLAWMARSYTYRNKVFN